MSVRALLVLTGGRVPARLWVQAATEAPAHGRPQACSDCPLRVGGELEAEARRALDEMGEADRRRMATWGCHADDRPCAGMRRLLVEVRS